MSSGLRRMRNDWLRPNEPIANTWPVKDEHLAIRRSSGQPWALIRSIRSCPVSRLLDIATPGRDDQSSEARTTTSKRLIIDSLAMESVSVRSFLQSSIATVAGKHLSLSDPLTALERCRRRHWLPREQRLRHSSVQCASYSEPRLWIHVMLTHFGTLPYETVGPPARRL